MSKTTQATQVREVKLTGRTIYFRWTSFGAPIVVTPRGKGRFFESRHRPTGKGFSIEYHVEITNDADKERAIAEICLCYADDDRMPNWLRKIVAARLNRVNA